jgi:parvulin-like peptidyl-prolyl isomerase
VAGQAVGVSQNDLRAFFAEEVLRDKVMESVVGPAPTEQEQVLVRHILVNTEAEANDVLSALQNGESFAALARAVSQDDGQSDGIATGAAGSASRGGLLDWAGRGSYVDAFEEAVWNAEVGQVLGPIQTEFGYHIIQVTDKQVRPLIGAQSEQAQERAFREWLDAQREEKATTFSYWSNRVVNDPSLPEMGLPEELLFRSLGMQ